jgi:hypothetical protein
MAFRTLHTFGTVNGNTAAIIKVDDNLVHAGPLTSGLLFEFITDVTLHGNAVISIEILYGSLLITHNRVTYPALIRGTKGYVNMPQPIIQPNLPLLVENIIIYDHYMFNGPNQWIIDTDTDNQVVVLHDFYNAVSTKFIIPDWQYDAYPVKLDSLDDISKLKI